MAYKDIRVRRARDLERHHRRTEARRAAGLCLKCGKTEPEPERTLCAPCAEKRNAADRARSARLRAEGKPVRDPVRAKRYERERSRRLHSQRKAAGICTKCGQTPARPDRTTCEPCAEQHRARDRARYARAKARGIPCGGRDPEAKRRADRARSRRRSEARRAAGLCVRCGHVPTEEGRSLCEPCRDDRRAARRTRDADRRAAGLCVKCAAPVPGGKTYCGPCGEARNKRRKRNPETSREADRRRYAERRARGDCTSCGKPANGAAECQACRDAGRARYHARRAAGVCVKCRTPTFGGAAYCAPCAVAKAARRNPEAEQAARRRRYAERRAKGRCVECNTPSPGVARCEPCSRKHRESSGAFRGIPVLEPQYTVIELETGIDHGTYDSMADVILCLAFAKLSAHQVEVVRDAPVTASLTGWE